MSANWEDLKPRILSAIALLAIAAFDLWFGGWVWITFVSVVCGLVTWELSRMHSNHRIIPIVAGLVVSDLVLMQTVLPVASMPFAIAAVLFAAAVAHPKGRLITAIFILAIYVTGLTLVSMRLNGNTTLLLWILAIVVATDIGGYFCGRMIGGPKLWPAVSPKKTWSGTIGGWVAALIITPFFVGIAPWTLAGAVLFSSASQVGDLAQSAVKRRVGVKDSSNLIPGHGGVFDRFDGVIGAFCLAFVILALLSNYAPSV